MPKELFRGPVERVNDTTWRIPKSYRQGMRVDGIIYADDRLMESIRQDQALEQVANVAFLPGIQMASLAMPDIHWGYGFCIGGVCATDPLEGGVISPGGVGYDINCGVRLVRSKLFRRDVEEPHQTRLVEELYRQVPAGTGRGGKYRFSPAELRRLMGEGVSFLVDRGLAVESDLEHTEARGRLAGAEPDSVSPRALERGYDQCGTLGSGNHFLEVQVVDAVFDEPAARAMGLAKDMICVMIHSGSRGLGYQVCDDALKSLRNAPQKYGIELPDRQLVCAPIDSPEGQSYIGAMCAAANFAWCNRQLLMWQARECFETVFNRTWQELGMSLVYDVAHNIAKLEEHAIDRGSKRVWVHRKGATRAFPPGHADRPAGHHPRRHGPRQLGAGWATREHAANLWHRLSRRRPSDEPHRRLEARPRPPHRSRVGRSRRRRPRPQLERSGRRAARSLQGRRPGRRSGPPGRTRPQSRPHAADWSDQGLSHAVGGSHDPRA